VFVQKRRGGNGVGEISKGVIDTGGSWVDVFSRQARPQAHIACISGAIPKIRITRLKL